MNKISFISLNSRVVVPSFVIATRISGMLKKCSYLLLDLFYKVSITQDRVFPDRLSAKPSCHNVCSSSRVHSDACLLTNTITKIP